MDPTGHPCPPNLEERRQERLKYQKWALIPVLVCYVFGGGMNLYIVPEYIQHTIKQKYRFKETVSNFTCLAGEDQQGVNNRVQQESAKWNAYLALASYIPAIFTNIILGSYSDMIGRKLLLVINLCGTLLRTTLVMVIIKLELELFYFICGNVIDGLTGSFTTLLAISFSYVSDLTSVGNQRTLFIVLLELVLALSLTCSAIAVGYFINMSSFFYPSMVATVVSFLAVIIAAIAIPETLSRNGSSTETNERTGTTSCFRLLQTARNIWTLYFGGNDRKTSVKYILLLTAFTFTCIAKFGNMDTLYQLGSPFCWSPTRIGWYAALSNGLSATVGLFIAYLLKKVLPDEGVAAIGNVSMIIGYVLEAVAKNATMLYFVPLIGLLGSLPVPMIRSLMSHMTSPDMQGALFASIGSVETICILVGSLTNNIIYAATLGIMKGFVFLVTSAYVFISLVLIISFMVVKRCDPHEPMLLGEAIVDDESDDDPVDLD